MMRLMVLPISPRTERTEDRIPEMIHLSCLYFIHVICSYRHHNKGV